MNLHKFKHKVTYNNNILHTKFTSLSISIYRDNTITVNNHIVNYTNNKLITDLVFYKNQYDTLLELFNNGFMDWLKYLNTYNLKIACNVKFDRYKGSFLYLGNLNTSYKVISPVYKNLDDLLLEQKSLKLKKVGV